MRTGMKLFTKTLLFFIGIIAFQSVLTILLVANVTRRTNLADARRELEGEASSLYDGFNSWKRQIWISLIGIGNDRRLARVLTASKGHPPREEFSGSLKEFIYISKIDSLVLADPRTRSMDIVHMAYNTFDFADLRGLAVEKPDPYLELTLIRNILCIVGVTTIDITPDFKLNLFLIKRIDSEFCSQLTLNRKSRVALLLGNRCLAGTLIQELPPLLFDPNELLGAYLERYNVNIGGERFNMALQKTGMMGGKSQGEDLLIGTFLSNDPYNQRILQVSRALFLVSAAGALLTILLSLFLSRNITHPIGDLLLAMQRVKSGHYDTQVGIGAQGGFEIRMLFRGFDEMAREIAQSRTSMQEYIRQTVLLKEYNEKIINSIKAGIAIVNGGLIVEKANSSFVESFGRDGMRLIGAPLTELDTGIVDAIVVEKVRAIVGGELDSYSGVKRGKSGKVYEIKLYPFSRFEGSQGDASGCVFVADDVSARTELEHKIFQAEKLSSISMLSAGMAHEINNPLGSILTNVQNLIEEEASPKRRVSLKWIEQETRRIAHIVQELLNFASADAGRASGSDVNAAVAEALRLVGYSLAREDRIRIGARLRDGLPLSVVSADELKQVVINLVKNSIQAIEGAGRILVCTRIASGGEGIALSISDTGKGIPAEIVSRIFDPFFTTKANGEGTGLGLSVVYGIVAKYNGSIAVRSREGRGTRMAIRLPILKGAQA